MSTRSRVFFGALALVILGCCLPAVDHLLIFRVFGLPLTSLTYPPIDTPFFQDGEVRFKAGVGILFGSVAFSALLLARNRRMKAAWAFVIASTITTLCAVAMTGVLRRLFEGKERSRFR